MTTFSHGVDGFLQTELVKRGPHAMLSHFQFISGHFTVANAGPLCNHPTVTTVLLSIVRQPLQQAWSYFHWMKRQSRHPLHAYCADKTLLEALEHPQIYNELSNIQTRYLIGKPRNQGAAQKSLNKLVSRFNTIIAPINKIKCAVAQVHELMKLVGACPECCDNKIENVSPFMEPPTESELEAISELTQMDKFVYEFLSIRWEEASRRFERVG
jgi:hypothetical protein